MRHACIIVVCGCSVIAAAFTAVRSLAAETGRAERWTSKSQATGADIKNDTGIRTGHDEPHSNADASTGSSLRARVGSRR
jgi:hypothetical protein